MRRRDFIALLGGMMVLEVLARLPLVTWTAFALLTDN